MNKYLKLIAFLVILTIIYVIYIIYTPDPKRLNYVALGDSIAEGINSYNAPDYGYPDYISDYLRSNKRLGTYTKNFSKSGYRVENIVDDINNNKSTLGTNNKTITIKEALRESDLVTISIGANDLMGGSSIQSFATKLNNMKTTKEEVDEIAKQVEDLLILVKKYAKGQIILVGYYNPLPTITSHKSQIDEVIIYANNKYLELAENLEIDYVDVFELFIENIEFLPNPSNIHPNNKGYEAMSKEVIKKINK
jgi:Lysophospholipase L1 and related esterases